MRLMKAKEYAALTGQHVVTVQRNCKRGLIAGAFKTVDTPHGHWLIPVPEEFGPPQGATATAQM